VTTDWIEQYQFRRGPVVVKIPIHCIFLFTEKFAISLETGGFFIKKKLRAPLKIWLPFC
jgi:hypothetical protein